MKDLGLKISINGDSSGLKAAVSNADAMINGLTKSAAKSKTTLDLLSKEAKSLDIARDMLNVRSFEKIDQEILGVNKALKTLQTTGRLSAAELANAFGAAQSKIAQLNSEKIKFSISKDAPKDIDATTASIDRLSGRLANMGHLATGMFAINQAFDAMSKVATAADSFSLMSARLKLATQSAQEYATAQSAVNAIANKTQTSVEDIGKLYSRLADSSRTAGKSQQDLIKVVETVANSGKVSGASIAEMGSTITQLSQVLASGTAQWEDFGQLTDTNMRLVRVVLKGMGTDIGTLKNDMANGKVSSQQVFDAILKGYEQLKAESATMPKTIGGSMQEMSNQFQKYIGTVDQANGTSRTLAEGISYLSGHLKEMTVVAGGLASGLAVLFGASMVARIGSVANAIKGVGLAMTLLGRHPLIAVATVGATYLGSKLLSDADLTRVEKLKQELAGLENNTTHAGLMGPLPGRDEGKISKLKAEIAGIEALAAAEDKARQAKVATEHAEEEKIRADKLAADASKQTTIASDIELLKARGKMREAYVLEAKEVKNLSAEDQKRYVQNKLSIDALKEGKKASHSAESASKKLSDSEQQRAKDIAKTLAGIREETSLIGLNTTARERAVELSHALAKAKGAEVEAIKQALAVKWQEQDIDKLKTTAQSELDAEIDKYKQLTMSVREYRLEKLKDQGLSPEQTAPIMQQFDKTAEVVASKAKFDESQKAAEAYNKTLEDTTVKTSDLNTMTSTLLGGMSGGITNLTSAFDSFIAKLGDVQKEYVSLANARKVNDTSLIELEAQKKVGMGQEEYAKKREEIDKNTQKYVLREKQLESDNIKNSLHGISSIAGATATMFKENTAARKAFSLVSLAAGVAEQVQAIANLTVQGAAATLNQGKGEPYSAFARMAAMAAAVASIIASVGGAAAGGAFNFGGTSVSGAVPVSPDSGTVLGDPTAKSESIHNTYTLLQDIHAKEYRELRGINDGVSALQTGITDSVTKLFQTGGLKIPAAALAMVGTQLSSIGKMITMGSGIGKFDPISNAINKFLFGTVKIKITDSGFYAGGNSLASILNGGQITAQQYTEITKTKKSIFGSSSKVSEMLSPLNEEVRGSLTKMFAGMGQSMLTMSNSFGTDMTLAVNNYVIPKLKVSLEGLSSEAMIKKLNNVLSTQMDKMATKIYGKLIAQYQALGEGMSETAHRLVIEKAVVMDAIDMTGGTFTGDAVAMADGLSKLAGGVKEFQASFQDYYTKFYSETEQLASAKRHLDGLLTDAGLSLPATRKGYRDLVNAQDLSTLSGRKLYTQLMDLAKSADSFYASQENLKKTAEDNLRALAGLTPTVSSAIYNMNQQLITARENWNAAGLSLTEMASLTEKAFAKLKESMLQPFLDAQTSIGEQLAGVNGTQVSPGDINAMMTALQAMTDPSEQIKQVAKIQRAVKLRYDNEISLINKTTSALKGISDFLAGLKLSDLSTLSPEQKLQEAKGQYGVELLKAQAGNTDALAKLPNLAKQYLDEAKGYYASSEAYAAIFDQVTSVLSGLTDTTLSTTDAAKAATDAANAGLTGSLTTLSSIIAGFVTSLGTQFDTILSKTVTPGVGAAPGGLSGNGGGAVFDNLSAGRDSAFKDYNIAVNTKAKRRVQAPLLAKLNTANDAYNEYKYWQEQGMTEAFSADKASKIALYDQYNAELTAKGTPAARKDTLEFMMRHYAAELKFRAAGGWTNGLTVVGEQGPELINFKGPAFVHNNAETQRLMAGNNSHRDNSAELLELQALVRLQAAANQALLDRLDKISGGISGIERKARLESAA